MCAKTRKRRRVDKPAHLRSCSLDVLRSQFSLTGVRNAPAFLARHNELWQDLKQVPCVVTPTLRTADTRQTWRRTFACLFVSNRHALVAAPAHIRARCKTKGCVYPPHLRVRHCDPPQSVFAARFFPTRSFAHTRLPIRFRFNVDTFLTK